MEGIHHKYSRPALVRVSRKNPCPVCGRSDWCSVSSDDTCAICMRVQNDRPTCNGGYFHLLGGAPPGLVRPLPRLSVPNAPRAEVDHIDAIFCTLFRGHLVLAEQHRTDLRRRGLDDAAIEQDGYRSVPSHVYGTRVARALSVYGLEGVPGCYTEAGRWNMVTRDPGYYIPVRDERARITGSQIRRDEMGDGRGKFKWLSSANRQGGASSGSPLHYAKSHLLHDAREVLITEGALKANVIAHFLGCPVIAAAGVTNFGQDFAIRLREKFPHLRTTVIAFDSDWRTKPPVKSALTRLQRELWRAGFAVLTRTWPARYKGLDDFLRAPTLDN